MPPAVEMPPHPMTRITSPRLALPPALALRRPRPPRSRSRRRAGARPAGRDAAVTRGRRPDGRAVLRLLLGDVALQRGETSVAARAYLEAARETQDARLARRATEIALARGSAASRRRPRSCGPRSIRRPSGRSRCSRRSPQRAARGDGSTPTFGDDELKSGSTRPRRRGAGRSAASARRSCSSTVCSAQQADKKAGATS